MKAKILGLLAVTLLAGPLATHAATLTATPIDSILKGFTVDFTDTNNNSLFDLSELLSFSGFVDPHGFDVVSILSVPGIAGFSVAGAVPGANTPDSIYWYFERDGSVDLAWDFGVPPELWTYAITGLSSVPEPGTLALLGLGLAGLGLSRRRKAN